MLQVQDLSKKYHLNHNQTVLALDHVSFTLPESGMVFLVGKSGSGKTTMLNLLGGLDVPTEGELRIDGVPSAGFRQKDWDAYRNNYVGFVFQEYNLLDDLTVGANIALALNLQGKMRKADAEQRIAAVLEQVGLSGYGSRKPSELSGGQKQRIAIARALVKNPQMILADEPTGALDSENGQQIFDLLKEISTEKLVVIVSHDEEFARQYADRIIELSDGKVIFDSNPISPQKNSIPPQHSVQRTSWPLSQALRLGAKWTFGKKLSLAVTAFLCAAALTFVGTADVFASYVQKEALVRSLFAAELNYMTVSKEWYNNYDFGVTSLMLPTEEAVAQLANSELRILPGKAGWYDGYMLRDEDLTELTARTGQVFKGVYVPHNIPMLLGPHYLSYKGAFVVPKDQVVTELHGFMELTEADLSAFDATLLDGRLPHGAADEIAISKYVYESFLKTGYYGFGYNVKFIFHCGDGREVYLMPLETLLNDGHTEFSNVLAQLKAEYAAKGVTNIWWEAWMSTDEERMISCDIHAPEDLIGKTLFIENRNYTITGIVDTGFTETDAEARNHELTMGLAGLAFVGQGKIREIAARSPLTLSVNDLTMEIPITDPVEHSLIHDTIACNTFTKLSTVPNFLGMNLATGSTNQGKMFFMDHSTMDNPDFKYSASYNNLPLASHDFLGLSHGAQQFKFSAVYSNGAAYGDHGWQVGQWVYTTENAIFYELDGHSGNLNVQRLNDSIILEDFYFDLLTEGRGGLYYHAIGVMPDSKEAISAFIDQCNAETGHVRYPLEHLITDEISYLHSTMTSIQSVSRSIALAMILFAVLVFSVFLSISIRNKQRDIGILRALGASGMAVLQIFAVESMLLWMICSILSIGFNAAAINYVNQTLQTSLGVRSLLFDFTTRQAMLVIAVGLIISVLASLIPILRIARQKPVDAIQE